MYVPSQFFKGARVKSDATAVFNDTSKTQMMQSSDHMSNFAASFTSLEGHILHIPLASEVVADLYLDSQSNISTNPRQYRSRWQNHLLSVNGKYTKL